MAPRSSPPVRFTALDRNALILTVLLSLMIAFFILKGDRALARVRDFTWHDRQVGAEDTAFLLTFSRPMDHASVEQNLTIDPPLPGKVSWAGRRMAYTLDTPAPYGQQFTISLNGGRDRFSPPDATRAQMQPFTSTFTSRDRAFVYLGVTGEEAGRLVLQNLTRQEQKILTPDTLTVVDFEPYPNGDRILFSASERTANARGLLDQQIYTVTTGIQIQAPATDPGEQATPSAESPTTQAAGQVERILDNQGYQNLKFDLAPDGQTIVVQRVSKENPGDFGLWLIQDGQLARPLETEPGGDFLIAPDSQSLAMSQDQGMAILPFESGADPLDFLPRYGMVLNFASDGTAAAMVKFNRDPSNPTRSLFLVTNQGTEAEILKTNGSIYEAKFTSNKRLLYVLYSRLIPGEDYAEQPYLGAIDLRTQEAIDLLQLPFQQDIQISLAPDSLGILFDQVVDNTAAQSNGVVRGRDGKAISNSRLWFLPLLVGDEGLPQPVEPQDLGISGLRPRWLP